MSYSTGFQSYGLIKSLAQQVLYRRAHLANVTTGMADPKEHHTTALMSQILSRNIFIEEHFAVLAEQPPSPASRRSVDIVVNYVTSDGEDLRILCICECKRTKTTQEWSLAALERQALDCGRICLKDTGVTFIYTATMAGCRMRLWKCEDGGDRYLFTPFWGTNTTGDWNEYIDVGGHHGDVEQITTAFNHMKRIPPTPRHGQTQESYGTQDFAPATIYSDGAVYDAAAEHGDEYNAGQSSYADPPPNAYDDEPVAMDDGYNAGQSSYADPPPNAYDDEPVAMDGYNAGQSSYADPPPNAYDDESVAMDDDYAPPVPDHRQKDVEGVTLTRISRMLREDEFQFTDKKHHTRTTVRSDWTKGRFNGRSGYWYSGRKTDYFTRYKF